VALGICARTATVDRAGPNRDPYCAGYPGDTQPVRAAPKEDKDGGRQLRVPAVSPGTPPRSTRRANDTASTAILDYEAVQYAELEASVAPAPVAHRVLVTLRLLITLGHHALPALREELGVVVALSVESLTSPRSRVPSRPSAHLTRARGFCQPRRASVEEAATHAISADLRPGDAHRTRAPNVSR
jgi:hypothetical protein